LLVNAGALGFGLAPRQIFGKEVGVRLAFDGRLIVVDKFDAESVMLADGHYSRQKPGTNQFMPPGRTIVIRDPEGTVVFGWLSQQFRDDGENGYNCSIFRNVSGRLSSDVILECEQIVFEAWGENRVFTYVDPLHIRSVNPGYCFKKAGWIFVRRTQDGKHLLAKELG
jgi:hypothetical protein